MKTRNQAVTIRRASDQDRESAFDLLRENGLPLDGLKEHWGTALVAVSNGRLVGTAALELYGDGALLRSVAVDSNLRGQGVGLELTAAALELAREVGAQRVYLLTETAGAFFPRFGFRPTSREDVPEEVKRSVEFTSACPASALVMVKEPA